MLTGKSLFLNRRGSLAAFCGAALVLSVVLAGAVAAVGQLPSLIPAGTNVSAADDAGVNLLEPADSASSADAQAKVSTDRGVEKVVGEWIPTGGGKGGGGSPKG
jgi:hypothetical protein